MEVAGESGEWLEVHVCCHGESEVYVQVGLDREVPVGLPKAGTCVSKWDDELPDLSFGVVACRAQL